jgi:hypothetical protein
MFHMWKYILYLGLKRVEHRSECLLPELWRTAFASGPFFSVAAARPDLCGCCCRPSAFWQQGARIHQLATPASPLREMARCHVAVPVTAVAALRTVTAGLRRHRPPTSDDTLCSRQRQTGGGSTPSDVEVLLGRRQKNDGGERWNYCPRKEQWLQKNSVNCCQLANILAWHRHDLRIFHLQLERMIYITRVLMRLQNLII